MSPAQIAKVCHETNRAYCETQGDFSQVKWEEAPQWQKDSATNGVIFHLNNPDATPAASHESWLDQKRREGWTWGPEKNVDLKQHPCFIPYDGLPEAQRVKDSLFKGVVDALRGLVEGQNRATPKPA